MLRATRTRASRSWWDKVEQGVEARLVLEPGGAVDKDNYFDNAQLLTQTKLAMEVFDAMDRHEAPPRDVLLPWSADNLDAAPGVVAAAFNCTPTIGPIARGKQRPLVRLQLGMRREGVVRRLPSVRCKALFLYDHSSGHEAGATDGRSATSMTKGPDWNGKQPWMRDGCFADPRGPSWPDIVQKMQYEEGDKLPCDVPVPSGIDPDAGAAPAATTLPQVLPEQLLQRSVVKNFGGIPITGTVMLVVDDDLLVCKFDVDGVSEWELTVDEVLTYLVGPAPEPEQHQEAPPSEVETEAAIKEFLTGIRPRLKKNNKDASTLAIRNLADAEWLTLASERRLHFVRKARSKAAAAAQGGACSSAASLCPPDSGGGSKACRRCSSSVGCRAACAALARIRRRTGGRSYRVRVGRRRRCRLTLVGTCRRRRCPAHRPVRSRSSGATSRTSKTRAAADVC